MKVGAFDVPSLSLRAVSAKVEFFCVKICGSAQGLCKSDPKPCLL